LKISEIKDVVKDLVGDRDIPEHMLDYALGSGLREIEKRYNGWWMRSQKAWNAVDGQQQYLIRSAASGGLNLPDYKDVRTLLTKDTTATLYQRVEITEFDIAQAIYATDSTGEPEMAVVDNVSLYLFPPDPDQTWNMLMYYWQFTNLPAADDSEDHEILRRWPEALIYAASMHLMRYLTKDDAQAAGYQLLMEAELKRLDRYIKDREIDEHMDIVPQTGPKWPARFRRTRSAYSWV
jgi:hypothetical protein